VPRNEPNFSLGKPVLPSLHDRSTYIRHCDLREETRHTILLPYYCEQTTILTRDLATVLSASSFLFYSCSLSLTCFSYLKMAAGWHTCCWS